MKMCRLLEKLEEGGWGGGCRLKCDASTSPESDRLRLPEQQNHSNQQTGILLKIWFHLLEEEE